jgi:hypothetical protein
VLLVSLNCPFLSHSEKENIEKLATQCTQDEDQHGHSEKENLEKLATQGTQDESARGVLHLVYPV